MSDRSARIINCVVGKITGIFTRIPPHGEERFAIVTNVEAGSGGHHVIGRVCAKTAEDVADGQAVWS
jgi:hypothetical protein